MSKPGSRTGSRPGSGWQTPTIPGWATPDGIKKQLKCVLTVTPSTSLTVFSAVDGYLQREREQRRQAMCVGDRRRGAGLTRWAAVDSTRRGWSWRRRPRSRPSVPRRTPVRRRARRTRVLTCADGEGMTLEKLEAAVVEQGKVFPRCVRVCSIAFRDRSTRSVARRLMIELADTWTGIGRS